MTQVIKTEHWTDANGNPAGGVSSGTGFCISWQNGPLGRGLGRSEPNGAFVETILQAVIDRLDFYQAPYDQGGIGTGKFACQENDRAMHLLMRVKGVLENRTADRERRGVEGTHEV